jgi:hypothetical protein
VYYSCAYLCPLCLLYHISLMFLRCKKWTFSGVTVTHGFGKYIQTVQIIEYYLNLVNDFVA